MRRTLSLRWILIFFCTLPISVMAAEPVAPPAARRYDPRLYLPRLTNAEKALEQGQADVKGAPRGRNSALEVLATMQSMVGDVDGAIATYDRRVPAAQAPLPPQPSPATPRATAAPNGCRPWPAARRAPFRPRCCRSRAGA